MITVTNQPSREPKMRVRLPDRASSSIFPGWGPKF
jgi:hypothetical protein